MTRLISKIRLILLTLGTIALALMIHQIGVESILNEIKTLGFSIFLILIPYLLSYSFDTLGWKATLGSYKKRLSFTRLFLARTAGESVNYLTPLAYLGGEPVKAYALRRYDVPLVQGLASVVIAKTTMTVSEIIFVFIGIIFAALRMEGQGPLLSGLLFLLLIGVMAVGLFFLAQKKGLFGGCLSLLERLHIRLSFLRKKEDSIRSLDRAISDFYSKDRRGFFLSLFLFFLGWISGAFEVYLVLYFLGIPIDITDAIIIEALASIIKSAAFIIPGAVGAQEGGNLLIFSVFGLALSTGITFSFVRRFRELILIGVGLLILSKYDLKLSPSSFSKKGDAKDTSPAGIK